MQRSGARRLMVAAVSACFVVGSGSRAVAGEEGLPSPQVQLIGPAGEGPAPRDSRVEIYATHGVARRRTDAHRVPDWVDTPLVAEMMEVRTIEGATIAVGRSEETPAVPLTRLGQASHRLFVLTPTELWPANAELSVVVHTADWVARVGAFRTSDQAGNAAPSWAGLRRADFVVLDLPRDSGAWKCHAMAYARLGGAPRPADGTVFPYWVGRAGERIDYTTPPTGRARLGERRWDPRRREEVLYVHDLPRELGAVVIGVRAMDAAGRMSAPSELSVRLDHPRHVRACGEYEAEATFAKRKD